MNGAELLDDTFGTDELPWRYPSKIESDDMGFGDEIMAAAEAMKLQARDEQKRKVVILDRHRRPRWHDLWRGVKAVAHPNEVSRNLDPAFQWMQNGPGCRPYVDYVRMAREFALIFPGQKFTTKVKDKRLPWRYTTWRATRADLPAIKLAPKRRLGTVLVEPHIKSGASPNKTWPWGFWVRLVADNPDIDWIQVGPTGTTQLPGVRFIQTENFLAGCHILSSCGAAVLPEGGLHHAAAAIRMPAVVIFGGMTSPANTGYSMHINLTAGGDQSPCGQRVPCQHCDAAMRSITPTTVIKELRSVLQ